jgi:large subunit ribosomal protein L22
MRSTLANYIQSPRKVRLVADVIRGMDVPDALLQLSFLEKRAAGPLKKALLSAVANAKENDKKDLEYLYVKEIVVDKGTTLKRHRPAWRGMAHRINRRRSHVRILLAERQGEKKKDKANKSLT